MANTAPQLQPQPLQPHQEIGVSYSLHRCSELGLDKMSVLEAAILQLKVRRFRLMSYWNIHEPLRGQYNFTELDWQFDLIARYGGRITLCVGKRQPRWPECHIPQWAVELAPAEWYEALYEYVRITVERYRHHPALESYQLENEALLKDFGYCPDGDYNPKRLKKELEVVRTADARHPVIMTLSNSWGVPVRKPRPDIYATSLYRGTLNKHKQYKESRRPAWFYEARALVIRTLYGTPVFIHELQAEPWLDRSILETPVPDQLARMNPAIFEQIVAFARSSNLRPIDLWGLEWWYWLKEYHNDEGMWRAAQNIWRSGL